MAFRRSALVIAGAVVMAAGSAVAAASVSVVGAVAGAVAGAGAAAPPGDSPSPALVSTPPSATPRTPKGWNGELAYVSGAKLTIVGRSGRRHVVRLPARGVPTDPSWSHDGSWLSFFVHPEADRYGPPGTLWIARADGTDAHAIGRATRAAWDPRASVLAYLHDGALSLLSTGGSLTTVTPLGMDGEADTLSWSPSGRTLAVSTTAHGVGRLVLLTVGDHHAQVLVSSTRFGYLLAGWWPDGRGLLYWEDEGFSSSIAADGLPLVSRAIAGGQGHLLATTLPYPQWVAWSPNGGTVAVVAGTTRVVWDDEKHVVLCQAESGVCRPEPDPKDSTAIDPAWSAAGDLYYFRSTGFSTSTMGAPPVHGLAPGAPFRWRAVEAWAAAGGLRTVAALGGEPRASQPVQGGAGGQAPTPAGRNLLFVRAGDLWLLRPNSTTATEVTGSLGLYGTTDPGYYGYDDWQQTFAWHR